MAIHTTTLQMKTRGNAHIRDLTPDVTRLVGESGLAGGIVTVFVPGSTGAVTTIEHEPGLVEDFKRTLESLVPQAQRFAHNELNHDDNGHSHVRAGILGPSLTVPFQQKCLTLGTWQQIVLVDLDSHPRERRVVVQVMGE